MQDNLVVFDGAAPGLEGSESMCLFQLKLFQA